MHAIAGAISIHGVQSPNPVLERDAETCAPKTGPGSALYSGPPGLPHSWSIFYASLKFMSRVS